MGKNGHHGKNVGKKAVFPKKSPPKGGKKSPHPSKPARSGER